MSDIEIARKAIKQHIKDVAGKLDLKETDLRPYGHHIAKIDMGAIK
jgi:Formyltetrahydrofolate synthetase